jgi:hypothetical protein
VRHAPLPFFVFLQGDTARWQKIFRNFAEILPQAAVTLGG